MGNSSPLLFTYTISLDFISGISIHPLFFNSALLFSISDIPVISAIVLNVNPLPYFKIKISF